MRRLSLLLVALAVALAGARLLHADDVATAVAMRDAAVLFTAAALLFALSATRPAIRRPQAVSRTWPAPGRVLTLTGLGSAALGGLLFGVADASTLIAALRVTLWLLGLVMLAVGVWWPGTVRRYSMPGFRWQQDAQGEFTRVPVDDEHPNARVTTELRLPFQRVWLAAVIAAGVILRAWPLFTMPNSCVANECIAALALVNEGAALPGFNLLDLLAASLHLVGVGPLLSVRLATLTVATLTLLLVWPTTRRLVGPAVGVVAVALLAFSPQHILAGRLALPWLQTPLFALGALWALHRAQHTGQRRDWMPAGLLLGLWGLTTPALLPGVLLLAVLALLIGVTQRAGWIDTWRPTPLLLYAGTFFVTVLPVAAVHGVRLLDVSAPGAATAAMGGTAAWSSLPLALAVLGLGLALRYIRLSEAATIATAVIVMALSAWRVDATAHEAALALLAPALLAAALAVDALLDALVASWRVLIRPSRLAAGLTLALLVPLIWAGARGDASAGLAGPGQAAPGARAMITAAGDALMANAQADAQNDGAPPLVVYLPQSALATAEAQIGLGPWIEQGRVQPLTLGHILDGVGRTQRVFLPPAARDWADVLRTYFPRSVDVPEFDPETGALLFWTMALVPEPEDGPGVTAVYVDSVADTEVATRREPDLDIELASELPDNLDATWRGSLRVQDAGSYRFDVIGLGPDDVFTLLLDGRLILDTSLDRPVGIEVLAAGTHALEARLRTAAKPSRVAVRWTPADGSLTPIPGDALFARPLPALGLEATYFANANFQPPGTDLRRDVFLTTVPTELPVSIVWRGKMAANRAGEYLLGIVADGDAEILLNGAPLAANSATAASSGEGGAPGYAEGVAFLEPGWHDVEVRFAPAAATSTLSLLWQPPGGQPTALAPLYLRPREGALTPQDEPLPAAPALTDARLERDGFALTQGVEVRRPQSVRLPQNLPPLLGQLAWESANGCGPGLTQLAQPHGAALDPVLGRVYVADTGNARVAIFTADGVRLGDIVDPALQEPVDVAVAADGAVFVLDAGTQQVLQLNQANGTLEPLTGGATFYRPRGLAALDNGLLAVADTGGARVVLIDRSGAQLADFGGLGTALGRGQPVDVVQADGALWATSSEDGRLWNVDVNGSVAATQPAVSMDGPHLAALGNGGLFLSDPTRATVHYHTAGGRPSRSFAYPDMFDKPTGLAATVAGNEIILYVVDTARCAVSAWQLPLGALE